MATGTGEGKTENKSRSRSVLLRVQRSNNHKEKLIWYKIPLSSVSDDSMLLRPCDKEKVKKMAKEAKKRAKKNRTKYFLNRERALRGQEIEVDDEDSAPVLNPICQTLGIRTSCFWTPLGSVVYCFSSTQTQSSGCDFGRVVKFFDVSDLGKGGNRAPSMINSRYRGKSLAVDDKIYVFGGTNQNRIPWAEVFDSKQGNWKALKEPPIRIKSEAVFALPVDDKGGESKGRILIGSLYEKGLYAYCVYDDSWNVVDQQFDFQGACYSTPVLVGDMVYWVGRQDIFAYHIHRKEYFWGRIRFCAVERALQLAEVRCVRGGFPLIHLEGDEFCLIWDAIDYGRDRRSMFVCHKFRVVLKKKNKPFHRHGWDDNGSLSVKPLAMEYFLINGKTVSSFDGMVLNTGDTEAYGSR